MRRPTPQQIGVCSWSLHAKDPRDLAEKLRQTSISNLQMHLSVIHDHAPVWGDVQRVLAEAGVRIVSGMFGCVGEDYSTLEAIRRTGGVVPAQHWEKHLAIASTASKVAGDLGIEFISTHAGFLPEEPSDPSYAKLQDRLAQIAAVLKHRGQTLLFETGQESADTLLRFLQSLKRKAPNIGVNFDPANMILYGKGEPGASLRRLLPCVRQVHVKDAVPTEAPGTWGTEVAVGNGKVNWRGFIDTLAQGDFRGMLIIEREAGSDRIGDVRQAASLLSQLMA